MTRTARTALLIVLLAAALAACSDDPRLGATSVICDGGDLIESELGSICVYEGPITETRFTCPVELPHRYLVEEGLVICTSEEIAGSDLEDELRERGYLDPPEVPPGNNDANNDLPINNAANNDANNDVNNNNANNDVNNITPEPCADGAQMRCLCPDGTPGAQTCAAETWGECVCRESWTAPGVNEVQPAPVDCPDPSIIGTLQADVNNAEAFGGPCVTEVFENACPLMRNWYDYERGQMSRDEREILNPIAFQQSIFHQYFGYNAYLNTWEISEAGRPVRFEADWLNDGTVETRTVSSWDAEGRPLTEETTGEGYVSMQRWEYDAQGRAARQESRLVTDDVDHLYVTVNTWREDGEPLETEITLNGARKAWSEWTYREDGRLERLNTRQLDGIGMDTRYTWREDGTLEKTRTVESGVGIEDGGREFRYTREIIERFYDNRGNELQSIHDNGGNGLALWTIQRTFDDGDRLLFESYGPLSGPAEWMREYVRGEDGVLLQTVATEVRTGRDHITTTTYDAGERPLRSEKREVRSEELLEATTWAWTEGGAPLLEEHDREGDGVVDSRATWAYDQAGNLLDHQLDHNADGFIEERTAHRYVCP